MQHRSQKFCDFDRVKNFPMVPSAPPKQPVRWRRRTEQDDPKARRRSGRLQAHHPQVGADMYPMCQITTAETTAGRGTATDGLRLTKGLE